MLRLLRRAATALAVALALLLVLAPAAAAHVTVSSADAAPGGYGKLTFRVPNESGTARTVAVRISIPEEAAMGSLQAQPVPGWTVTLTRTELPEPIDVHGRQLTEFVSLVEFRAEDGGGVGPAEFQEFALSGGPFPDVETVSYPTVQVYSDGNEAAWIEPTVDGQEPESPAPTLELAAADEPSSPTAPVPTTDAGSSGAATTALVLSVLGLVAGLAGCVLGWSARRRTVGT